MALALTEEHLQLAESVRGWAQRTSPPETVRAAADGEDSGTGRYREILAPGLAEQGLLGLHLTEDDGGQGFGLGELAVVVEELGRALLPGGFLPTVLASAVLSAAGVTGKLVAGLADGSRIGAVSLVPASGPTGPGLTATADQDGGLVVDGDTGPVLGGSIADLIILPVTTGSGEAWVAVDAVDLQVTPLDSLDLTRPLGSVRARQLTVPADRVLAGITRQDITGLAAVVLGAEACGIADWAVHTAAEYAKIREQFGRPIGQFQAVKHRCARMLIAAEQAAAAVWDAARALSPEDGADAEQRQFAAAVAAALAADAAVTCAHECIQVLGGIGYTWEHDAHFYYRRAMSIRALLGPTAEWRETAAKLALTGVRRPVRLELGDGESELRAQIRAELAAIAPLQGKERNHALATGGWVMPHMPKPWGRGAGALEQLIIDEEMRASGVRAYNLAIGAWVVPALIQYGSKEQQDRFLLPTLRMDYLWCQLFSEPGAGSDLAGLKTKAERVDGGWKITGQKIWTSLAREASWAICIARTNPAEPRHDGISYFLLDMHAPGVEVRPLRDITGGQAFNQVFLDGVFVPDDCVVGEINKGWKIARTTLANERVALSQSWTFGSGVTELLAVAKVAPQFDAADIGELVCDGHAIDLLSLRVALKQLSGTEPGATGSVRKLLGMRHAQRICEKSWELAGSSGALGGQGGPAVTESGEPNGAHWARQILLTEALTIGGGTTDIQLNIIAERILGLPRDPDPPAP